MREIGNRDQRLLRAREKEKAYTGERDRPDAFSTFYLCLGFQLFLNHTTRFEHFYPNFYQTHLYLKMLKNCVLSTFFRYQISLSCPLSPLSSLSLSLRLRCIIYHHQPTYRIKSSITFNNYPTCPEFWLTLICYLYFSLIPTISSNSISRH